MPSRESSSLPVPVRLVAAAPAAAAAPPAGAPEPWASARSRLSRPCRGCPPALRDGTASARSGALRTPAGGSVGSSLGVCIP